MVPRSPRRTAARARPVGSGYVASSVSVLTRNRDFRRLFAAELVVFGSDWFVMVPLLVLLPELTGSGVWGALVLAADTGIVALLLPYTGTIADRFDRRKIMMIANLAALVATLLLFFVRSAATAPLALVAIGAIAVAKAFYSPAARGGAAERRRPRGPGRRERDLRLGLGHDDDRRRVAGRDREQRLRPVRQLRRRRSSACCWPPC